MDEMDYKEMWGILKFVLNVSIKSDKGGESTPHYQNILNLMDFNEEMQKEDQ